MKWFKWVWHFHRNFCGERKQNKNQMLLEIALAKFGIQMRVALYFLTYLYLSQ